MRYIKPNLQLLFLNYRHSDYRDLLKFVSDVDLMIKNIKLNNYVFMNNIGLDEKIFNLTYFIDLLNEMFIKYGCKKAVIEHVNKFTKIKINNYKKHLIQEALIKDPNKEEELVKKYPQFLKKLIKKRNNEKMDLEDKNERLIYIINNGMRFSLIRLII